MPTRVWAWVQPSANLQTRVERKKIFFFQKHGPTWFQDIDRTVADVKHGDLILLVEGDTGQVRAHGRFDGYDQQVSRARRERCLNISLREFTEVNGDVRLASGAAIQVFRPLHGSEVRELRCLLPVVCEADCAKPEAKG